MISGNGRGKWATRNDIIFVSGRPTKKKKNHVIYFSYYRHWLNRSHHIHVSHPFWTILFIDRTSTYTTHFQLMFQSKWAFLGQLFTFHYIFLKCIKLSRCLAVSSIRKFLFHSQFTRNLSIFIFLSIQSIQNDRMTIAERTIAF